MKRLLLFAGLMLFASMYALCQVTVTFSVTSPSPLIVPYPGGLSNVTFNVALSKPSSQIADGMLYIYAKGGSFEAVRVSSGFQVTSGNWTGDTNYNFTGSFNITPSNLNQVGGVVYAQFEATGGVSYKSSNVAAAISIYENTITPPSQTTFVGTGNPGIITGSTPKGGAGTFTYQWESSTTSASAGYSAISGAGSISYDPPASTPSVTTTTYYRRKVTSGDATGYSNVVSITISIAPLANNSIANTGSASFTDSGDPGLLSGSAPTGGTGGYAYQWQYATLANPSGFTDISGATAQSYDPPVTEITRYFRRKVTAGSEVNYSNVITIAIIRTGATMSNPINIGDIGMCATYSQTFTNFPEYGYGNEWGNSTDDIFHKFNLTTPAKIWLGNCKSDGVSGGIALLDASGNLVSHSATDPCDAGIDLIFNVLQPGVYYIVSEGTGYQYETNYLPISLRVKPVFTTSSDVTIAAGTSATLQATGSGLTYTWSPSSGLNTTTGATVIATPAVTTTYTVVGAAPGGCQDVQYITVTVTGSVGSTFANPIIANFSGCQYNSPAIYPANYGNEYGGPLNDVFYKFTLTSATQVTIGPYWANDTQDFWLLNNGGDVITQFRYIYPSPDRVASRTVQLADPTSFTVSLQPGTYYVVVEGTYQNEVLGIFIKLPGCRIATASEGELNVSAENSSDVDLFPNPAKNDVTFNLQQESPATVHFMNSSGINVKQATIGENSTTVNTSDLSPGLYVLKIIQGKTVHTKKLRIEER